MDRAPKTTGFIVDDDDGTLVSQGIRIPVIAEDGGPAMEFGPTRARRVVAGLARQQYNARLSARQIGRRRPPGDVFRQRPVRLLIPVFSPPKLVPHGVSMGISTVQSPS